jgi:hypothetical protein
MIGDDWPIPFSFVFHTMAEASHFVGRLVSADWPSPSGPRQRGQLGSAADIRSEAINRRAAVKDAKHFITGLLRKFAGDAKR